MLFIDNNISGDKMNKSIWEEYFKEHNFPKLENDLETDVLIIGGGIVGILTANLLKDYNINCAVVEKDKIGRGTTSLTTVFLTIQHETLYQDLSENDRRSYLATNNKALKKYKQLSKIYDFDYKEVDSCLHSNNYDLIKKEYDVLKELGQDVYINKDIPFDKESLGISFKNQATINPIKLINALSNNLNIYEHTEVVKIKKHYAVLKNGKIIKFKYLVTATHYPINNKLNFLFMKLTQKKSYVCVIKKKFVNGTYCSLDKDNGLYYRMYKDYLIIGGNDTDTGCKCRSNFEDVVCKKFNVNKEDILYSWHAQDTISLDGIPYIGYSDIFHKNHIIVTGFNLWGFTWAMASSEIVLKIIKDKKYFKLTRLNRCCINKNLFKNIYTSIKNLLTFRRPRCTHLGCALIYNKKDSIYECPCHGSIYNKEGKVIVGPAKKNKII